MTPIQRRPWAVVLILTACFAPPQQPAAQQSAPAAPAAPPPSPQAARLQAAAATPPVALPPELEAYRPAVTALLQEGLARGEAYDKLAMLTKLAPHRLSGSPGAAAAVEWARDRMLRDGLQNVRLVPCMVPHWERGKVASLRIVAPEDVAGERLTILALGGSIATPPEGTTAEVVEVKSWDQLDKIGDGAKGKFVFFDRPMDPTLFEYGAAYGGAVDQRGRGAIEAARHGGVGAIVRTMTTRLDDVPHTGAMRYDDKVPQVPSVAVSTMGAERLSALLARGPVKVRLDLDSHSEPDAPSADVVGEIVGTEKPDEIVLLGGHLDCWDVGQGANDDGGGACQAIEALRLIKALDLHPKRTIRAVAFMNEENGGRGAKAYADSVKDALDKHVLAIESDGGVGAPRGFGASCTPEALAVLRSIALMLEPAGVGEMKDGGGGADIDPLREAGGVAVAAFRADTQHYFDLHHSERDTLDTVWPREINLGAAAMAALAYVVADRDEPLPHGPVPAPSTH